MGRLVYENWLLILTSFGVFGCISILVILLRQSRSKQTLYEFIDLKELVHEVKSDVIYIKDIVNNNTAEKLQNIIHTQKLDPMIAADCGIIRYFQSKLNDAIKQYELMRSVLLKNPDIDILSKMTDKTMINTFVGGGKAELMSYYNYKDKNGNICYYPDSFLNKVDELNNGTYDKFIQYYRDSLMYKNNKMFALKTAAVRSFEEGITDLYNLYQLNKAEMSDPQLKLQPVGLDIQTQSLNIEAWKRMIAEGDHNISTILRALLQSNLNENLFNLALNMSAQWNTLITSRIVGVEDVKQKHIIRNNLITFLDTLKQQ